VCAPLGLPVGIGLGVSLKRGSEDLISARELVTFGFVATQDFVNKSMKLASIESYLTAYSEGEAPPPLYMITGLKVAHGASCDIKTSTKAEGSVGFQAPGADVQKILDISRYRAKGVEFSDSTPFVLAFRAKRIIYKKRRWEHRLSKKGASMMDGSAAMKENEIEVSGIEDKYVVDDSLDEGIDYSTVQDEDVEWIVPGEL
jgi:hypothetical protein